MAIDQEHTTSLGSFAEDLADEIKGRVKSELEPGERLLWAAPVYLRPDRFSTGFERALILALILLVPSLVSWAKILENPLREIGGLLFFGLLAGVVEFFLVLGILVNRVNHRAQRGRLSRTLYALTDRRAIVWTPEPSSEAVKVMTFPRGRVSGVHRREFPDGSGDVLFRATGDNAEFGAEFWSFTGFLGVADVRRVEEQVRTLIGRLVLPPEGSNNDSAT